MESKEQLNAILVVDDNVMNRDLMSLQLSRKGFKVTLADSGFSALDILAEENFDIILLDIMMPGMSGIEVLETIRRQHSMLSLPIIMVTADDQQTSVIEALQKGANDYLVKPLNMAITAARIKTQLTTRNLALLKDEFLRFASHDLKKPLLVMQDIIETLQGETQIGQPVSEDLPTLLGLIHKTVTNMQTVVANFLDTESLQHGHTRLRLESVPLNPLIEEALRNNLEYARQKQVALTQQLATELPLVEADRFQISQVLDNLIGNAMKFSPAHSATCVYSHHDNQYVYVEICDGGPGIAPEDMEKLFVRHAQLSNTPTGNESSSGIGLSLSKQMIDLHHGRIGARNNEGQGSTFWFRLPIKYPLETDPLSNS